jgi:8-oxo-dGTP diphosphatase
VIRELFFHQQRESHQTISTIAEFLTRADRSSQGRKIESDLTEVWVEKPRAVRYQCAIIDKDHILLIRWRGLEPERTFWVIPGGSREPGESVVDALVREAREETHLDIGVGNLLFEEAGKLDGKSWMFRTYLCSVKGGHASPGCEPEDPQPVGYGIVELRWFDLKDKRSWDRRLIEDKITYPQLQKLRTVLGYAARQTD